MRFNNNNHRSLNESITKVQNPQVALDEALEYTAALESIILSICEELEIDPDELVEDVMTREREQELSRQDRMAMKKGDMKKSDAITSKYNRELSSRKYLYGKGGRRTLIPKKGTSGRAAYEKRVAAGKNVTLRR